MLQWTTSGQGVRFALYVQHTMPNESGLTTATLYRSIDKGLDEAKAKGWTVVDMKKDWIPSFSKQ